MAAVMNWLREVYDPRSGRLSSPRTAAVPHEHHARMIAGKDYLVMSFPRALYPRTVPQCRREIPIWPDLKG